MSVLCSALRFQSIMKREVTCEGPPLNVCAFHWRPLKHDLNCTEGLPLLINDLVDCGLFISRSRHNVLIVYGDVAAQHG